MLERMLFILSSFSWRPILELGMLKFIFSSKVSHTVRVGTNKDACRTNQDSFAMKCGSRVIFHTSFVEQGRFHACLHQHHQVLGMSW